MNTTIFVAEELGHPLRNAGLIFLYLLIIAIFLNIILRFVLVPLFKKVTNRIENKISPPTEPAETMLYQPLHNGKHCESCGRMNPSEAQYCIQCGHKPY